MFEMFLKIVKGYYPQYVSFKNSEINHTHSHILCTLKH